VVTVVGVARSDGGGVVSSAFFIAKSENRNQVHYGVHVDAACSPVGAEPEMTQEGVSDRDRPPVVADNGPVGERVGQRDTLRPHDGFLCGSQLLTWRTVSRGCDNDPAQAGSA